MILSYQQYHIQKQIEFIYLMSAIINRITKTVAKIRIQKPLSLRTQRQIISCLNQIQPYRLQGIIVVINSFGGSLAVAKNISNALCEIRDRKKIPIFCFAQDFCLNSANLILTTGTQAFANKFSVIGDFGYIYESFDLRKASQMYKIGKQIIRNNEQQIQTSNQIFRHNQNKIYNWLYTAQHDLRTQVIRNRNKYLQFNALSEQNFQKEIFDSGMVQVKKAKQFGLIDDIQNFNWALKTHFKGIRMIQPQALWRIKILNKIWEKTNPLTD